MATKREELDAWAQLKVARYQSAGQLDMAAGEPRGAGCLANAEMDEPLFILRAKDPLTPFIVRVWAQLAHQTKMHEADKVEAAIAYAGEMEAWRSKRFPPRYPPWKPVT